MFKKISFIFTKNVRFDIIKAHIFDSKIWIHCYELEIGLHSKKIDLYSYNYRHIYIKSVPVNVKRGLYWSISRWLKTILKKQNGDYYGKIFWYGWFSW